MLLPKSFACKEAEIGHFSTLPLLAYSLSLPLTDSFNSITMNINLKFPTFDQW